MKILAIRGKNLASLAGEFEVDFQQEPLASAGLFAISGPTGAGKSTLLDALCLALYDATPRLLRAGSKGIALPDVGEERVTPQDTRTLLRRGTADGHAEVDFIGSDGKPYRARWSVRRSRARTDGALQAVSMTLKHLADLQAIGGTNREVKAEIIQRIGLSFDQFTRAVLLAQNEFSAFLKADDGERGELLETLTGSTIYSAISRRAYERAKLEQGALQKLNDRLADQMPLPSDLREQLDQDSSRARQAMAQLDQRKTLLEQHLRWHQDWKKFQQQEQLARDEWQARLADQQSAASRQTALSRVEAVQAARPLLHEVDRLTTDIDGIRHSITTGETDLAAANQTKDAVDAAWQSATLALQAAEQARTAAAPQLDQAKALDAQIDAIMPSHRQARQISSDAHAAAKSARQALQAKEEERAKILGQQQEIDAWLTQNQSLQTLAENWPRWDTLFTQATDTARAHDGFERALAAARLVEANQHKLELDAAAKLPALEAALQAAEAKRQQSSLHLSGFDPQALATRRQAAETRRDLLAGAEKIWSRLAADLARRAQQDEHAKQITQAIEQAELTLKQAQHEHTGISAASAQAERSLKSAEAACGENVESLRATLQEGEHCPVCGALDHPYRSDNPRLHAVLAQLQAEVVHCRAAAQQNLEQQATQAATARSNRTQLAAITQELQTLATEIQSATLAWEAHALMAETDSAGVGNIAAAERVAWFTAQQETMQALMRDIAQQEQALRLATEARDMAQKEFERASINHNTGKDVATAAKSQLAQASAESRACADKCSDAAERLQAQLAVLAGAFEGDTDMRANDWKPIWRKDPQTFHAQRKAEAMHWQAQRQTREEHRTRLDTVEVERKALLDALTKADAEAARATSAFSAIETSIRQMQEQRRTLFDGKAAKQVEADFNHAIETAKAHLAAQTDTLQTCAATQTRCVEALAQARQRLHLQTQAAAVAAEALASWLNDFNQRHHTITDGNGEQPTAPLDIAHLRALLTHPADWIGKERLQLQAIAAAAADAASVLKERETQRAAHEQLRPAATTEEEESAETIQAALSALDTERRIAGDQAATLQLNIAQDNLRREQSAAMLTQIAQQENINRRWAQLNDLIGSADGKKFRNYAQQFTLDVLLGYANRHLHELSRRYRLERIKDTLALMVLDQDMGDETRSVHSLSGGESFLVSLALALGLASLSSNRVRVESLFIDEGFGSLDADTLRVAMDALDGLQAMGRKVGVISHVQEMTERIGAKILVRRTAGGKSQLSIGQA